MSAFRMKVPLITSVSKRLLNSNILSMHKSIYRHLFLWLEIDLDQGVLAGYYGTGIGERI
uniref:Uncharacterized protein n=1 Tax=uncultured prokaryote TaxID=198431 RepID=A0A0H5QJ83_9ZZZZ|nr:hypothetical protein [uncultured prokaryote]